MNVLADEGIERFGLFVDELESFLQSILNRGRIEPSDHTPIAGALDGDAGAALRRLVNVSVRRNAGAFFTGSALANTLVAGHAELIERGVVVADPACGAGDLLIACSARMPVKRTLTRTLQAWGVRLCGTDIEPLFVRTTILRLILEAVRRGSQVDCTDLRKLSEYLSRIRRENGMAELPDDVQLVVMNPPYGSIPAPPDCAWASGATARAAVFYDAVLGAVSPGCRMVAILPDVLRTGRRYQKWRSRVSTLANVETIDVIGAFDAWTDVDVFELHVQRTTMVVQGPVEWWDSAAGATLGDSFHVSVGPVVPFRDRQTGAVHPYIHPRNLEPWQEVVPDAEIRRYAGPVVEPPFVAIRRTSRPGDHHRAVATIVRGETAVAVENHLIVCKPHDGTLKSCRALMRRLRTDSTTVWLDERLRCRHLTVTAIRELPWQDH